MAIEFVFTLIRRIGQVVKKVVETKKKILYPQTDFVVIFSMETCGLKKITKTFGHDTDLTLCPRYFIQVGSCKGVGGSQVSKGMNHF